MPLVLQGFGHILKHWTHLILELNMKGQGDKFNSIHPLWTLSICTNFLSNPSSNCQDVQDLQHFVLIHFVDFEIFH